MFLVRYTILLLPTTTISYTTKNRFTKSQKEKKIIFLPTMKIKVNFTLDENIVNWLKEFTNQSEKVNEVLIKEYENKANPFKEFKEIQEEKEKIREKEQIIYEKIEKNWDEGDKKTRIEAEKILKIQKEKESEEKEQREELIKILKDIGLLDELLSCKNFNEILALNKKIVELGVKNPYSKMGNFGGLLLKEIAEFNKHFIPLESPEVKE